MLTPTNLDSPAKLQYWATDLSMTSSATDWDGARGFGTLREAVQFAIEEEPEGGQADLHPGSQRLYSDTRDAARVVGDPARTLV
jgi:hypothetical protein